MTITGRKCLCHGNMENKLQAEPVSIPVTSLPAQPVLRLLLMPLTFLTAGADSVLFTHHFRSQTSVGYVFPELCWALEVGCVPPTSGLAKVMMSTSKVHSMSFCSQVSLQREGGRPSSAGHQHLGMSPPVHPLCPTHSAPPSPHSYPYFCTAQSQLMKLPTNFPFKNIDHIWTQAREVKL